MARTTQIKTTRFSLRLPIITAAFILCGCKQSRPDPGPVATCSREAPDICWSQAKGTSNRQSDEAIAKFEIACQAEGFKHRALACTWAALGLQRSPEEAARAATMHETACEMGIQTSCAHLGAILMGEAWSGGPDADSIASRVRGLVGPVCEAEALAGEETEFGTDPRAGACATLAQHFEHGLGVEKDPRRAFEIWQRACELGSGPGCARVGFSLEQGFGVESDLDGAVEHYSRACDEGAPMGCANLAALYVRGQGVGRDYEQASTLYAKACERDFLDSCEKRELVTVLTTTEGDMNKRMDELLAQLDEQAEVIEATLDDGEPSDKEWVKKKLKSMFDVDQLYRRAFEYRQHFDEETAESFQKALGERMAKVDEKHLGEFKEIVEEWGWITLSEFDPMANDQAWLIVQHADRDVEFQVEILKRLETLRDQGEIDPAHYAYLYDRVAVNQEREQRYGTQGHCVDGRWEPRKMVEPDSVDERRAAVGLEPMAEYRKMFEGQCL